jgi:pimeloyl-ACP methyl ester carboxylesterase
MPGTPDRWRASGTAEFRANLRTDRGAHAGTARRRGAEAASGRASDGADAVVPAEMLPSDGRSSCRARGDGGVCRWNHVTTRCAAGDHLERRSIADTMAKHRRLAHLSSQSRHLVATKSGHWIQLDEPDLVVTAIRDIVRTNAAEQETAGRLSDSLRAPRC